MCLHLIILKGCCASVKYKHLSIRLHLIKKHLHVNPGKGWQMATHPVQSINSPRADEYLLMRYGL